MNFYFPLFSGMHNREVIEQVELGYRMPLPRGCPEQIYTEVMLKCWDKVRYYLFEYFYCTYLKTVSLLFKSLKLLFLFTSYKLEIMTLGT